jgi:hypothetical protein
MIFSKTDNIYKIIRITAGQDNILGISFAEQNNIENNIEAIEWDFGKNEKVQTSKKEVLNQALSGLKKVNESLGTNYKLSQIYSALIAVLIRHYHSGGKFEDVYVRDYY